MKSDEPQGVLAIWNDIRAGEEPAFESWYKNEHLPERLGVPGFRLGRRFEAIVGAPRYFCYYLVDTPEVLTSPAYLERLNNPTPLTRTMMTRAFHNMSRTICRRVIRRGALWGAYCVVARFQAAGNGETYTALLDELAGAHGVARAEFWAAADQGAGAATEEKLRGGDRKIAGCLVVETLRVTDTQRVAAQLADAIGASADLSSYRFLCELGCG